jgi:CheY-like chemotaxis protein
MDRPARILVVDDNLPLRLMLAQALEARGYVTVVAESGEAALAAADWEPPDLCLVDYVMPGMNGADLVRALRASTDPRLRAVPAIGLTGYEEGDRDLLQAGAAEALRKPCDEATLVASVARVLAAAPSRA